MIENDLAPIGPFVSFASLDNFDCNTSLNSFEREDDCGEDTIQARIHVQQCIVSYAESLSHSIARAPLGMHHPRVH